MWDKQQTLAVGKALRQAALIFDKDMPADRIRAYKAALEDLPVEAVLAGIKASLQTSRYFPTVADIRQPANGAGASEAWLSTLNMVRTKGVARARELAPPDINAVVRLVGGWDMIGQTTANNLPFVEKRFRERWGELQHPPFMAPTSESGRRISAKPSGGSVNGCR